jgi:Fe2+ or Zn2+ uptake regulation protein
VASDDLHETVALRLRRAHQRYTAGRRALVDVLAGAARPMTLPEVLSGDADIAQSSAYRNLVVLEEAGVVDRIVTRDEFARYDLAEDLTGHHHHLVCFTCGSVDDFALSPELEHDLGRAFRRVAGRAGFSLDHHRLDLVGRCARCA